MRILLVSHLYPPRHRAGTELYTANLARTFRRRGHEVFVFTTQKDIARRDLSMRSEMRDGVHVIELVNNLFHRSFEETFANPAIEERFERELDEVEPDVVHFMHLLYLSLGCARIAARHGIPAFYTMHDFWLACARFGQRLQADGTVCHTIDRETCARCMTRTKWAQTGVQRRVARAVAALRAWTRIDFSGALRSLERRRASRASASSPTALAPDPRDLDRMRAALADRARRVQEELVPHVERFYAPSRFLAEEMVSAGLPRERVAFLRVGIDALDPTTIPRTESARRRIGFLGTVSPHKGLHVLLDAWEALGERAAEATLTIHGSLDYTPEYVARMSARARELGTALRGPFPPEALPAVLGSLDLLVVPSVWYENSPLVILEALAAGLPLVVSDLGGMRELVPDERFGWRFPAGDVRALRDVLARFLDAPPIPAAARARSAEVVSLDENADVLLADYDAALRRRDEETGPTLHPA